MTCCLCLQGDKRGLHTGHTQGALRAQVCPGVALQCGRAARERCQQPGSRRAGGLAGQLGGAAKQWQQQRERCVQQF